MRLRTAKTPWCGPPTRLRGARTARRGQPTPPRTGAARRRPPVRPPQPTVTRRTPPTPPREAGRRGAGTRGPRRRPRGPGGRCGCRRPRGAAPAAGSAGTPARHRVGAQPRALRAQARELHARVRDDAGLRPLDVGYSAVTTRSALKNRGVVLAADRGELLDGLAALADGTPSPRVVTGTAVDGGRVVWVFSGQGAHWVGMARGLWETNDVFAARMDECERLLHEYGGFSLREVLGDEAALRRMDVVQPALFAVMVSLAEVWRAAGVTPDAVIGHSQGEIAAATAAGILSWPTACA
ncbi:acyltransferase domain-containing protein [Streptomyces zhihengii]